jgi:glycosyltransferase involved in cell wall biosynthesis
LYVGITKFLLIHHIHQEVFRQHLPFPFSHIAMFIESKLMPFIYRDIKVLTVSQSSKTAIYNIGLSTKRDVTVINPGIEKGLFQIKRKSKHPSIVYIGRLKPYKNVDVALKAFAQVVKKLPLAHFHIAGEGESSSTLKRMATRMELNNNVTFWGKISDTQKAVLFAKSWVAVQPSLIEGWGITVIEANASGTPVVASNVSGLSDSVVDGKTGYLVTPKNVDELTDSLIKILTDIKLRKRLSASAIDWAEQFTWRSAVEKLLVEIKVTHLQSKYVSSEASTIVST